jgi:hypothetical protein
MNETTNSTVLKDNIRVQLWSFRVRKPHARKERMVERTKKAVVSAVLPHKTYSKCNNIEKKQLFPQEQQKKNLKQLLTRNWQNSNL